MTSIHTYTKDLDKALVPLELPENAHKWLIDFFETLQGLDDWYDNDYIPQYEKLKVIHNCLVVLSSNPFFLHNNTRLFPLINNLILKWAGANTVEQECIDSELPKAYMWRAGFYDIVLEVLAIVHGFEIAACMSSQVLKMYGESFDSYKKEFTNA